MQYELDGWVHHINLLKTFNKIKVPIEDTFLQKYIAFWIFAFVRVFHVNNVQILFGGKFI